MRETRLTGQKLFKGDNCIDVLKENKACNIDYECEDLAGVPEAGNFCNYIFKCQIFKLAIDLLKRMLCMNPETRVSAVKALAHKYFECPVQNKSEPKISQLKNYRYCYKNNN